MTEHTVTRDEVSQGLARMVRVLGLPAAITGGIMPSWYIDEYLGAVADLYASEWRAAVDACIRECRFFPVPAELRAQVPEYVPPPRKPEPIPEGERVSREEISAMLRGLVDSMRVRRA